MRDFEKTDLIFAPMNFYSKRDKGRICIYENEQSAESIRNISVRLRSFRLFLLVREFFPWDSTFETVGGGAFTKPLRESPEPDQDKACVGKRIKLNSFLKVFGLSFDETEKVHKEFLRYLVFTGVHQFHLQTGGQENVWNPLKNFKSH